MQERLIIKNFGPIKDVDLDLRQTTIFIGEQASGKSTLAKLIGMFRKPQIFDINKNEEELYKIFDSNSNAIGLLNGLNEKTNIRYISEEMEVIVLNKEINIIRSSWFEKEHNGLLSFLNRIFQDRGITKIKSEKERYKLIRKVFTDFPEETAKLINVAKKASTLIYIPAERILIPTIAKSLFSLIDTGTNLPKAITRFGNDFEKARSLYKQYKIDFLDIEYKHDGNHDFINHGDIKLELFQSSSGLQSIVPMILVIDYFSENSLSDFHFIVEEPELNLYPTTQHNLMKFILSKCRNKGNQLTITTHSPYNLSTLNVLLLAYQTGQKDEAATNKVIPKASWVNPDHFNAYFVEKGGTVRQIFDRETGMIAENELDNVSLAIGDEFDTLMDIYSSVSA